MSQKKKRANPLKDIFKASKFTESKSATQSMVLEYAFDKGVDLANRVYWIDDEITNVTWRRLDAAMNILESMSKGAVTIRINSEGGDVYAALAIVGRLTSSTCKIITEGSGAIMSAAALILACGDKRRMSKYAYFMHHEASYEADGRHSNIKNEVAHQEIMERDWASHMEELTNESYQFWTDNGKHVDFHLNADQCLEHGVVDEVIC